MNQKALQLIQKAVDNKATISEIQPLLFVRKRDLCPFMDTKELIGYVESIFCILESGQVYKLIDLLYLNREELDQIPWLSKDAANEIMWCVLNFDRHDECEEIYLESLFHGDSNGKYRWEVKAKGEDAFKKSKKNTIPYSYNMK